MDSEIPKDYDHKKEAEWQRKWEEQKIYKFDADERKPQYIIDTPPPYPTGSIHMGHVLNWVYMDVIARFKRMRGFNVLFPQGWDCHGLPTEVKVEETYNIKKSSIPREEFRELCIKLTTKNIKQMKEQMKSLGFSQDWSTEFVTMTPEYMKKTQLSFLKMYEDGLIYRGVHPVNWCPRCETAIAFAEVEYIENETDLNYLKFPLEGSGHLEIATTRPELLAACVAVAVHPEDERYKNLKGEIVRVPLFNQKVKIIEDEEVDPEFGTGAVMICTFGDKTDVTWVNRHNLDIIEAIDEKGRMTEAAGKYKGLTIKECKERIIEDLEKEGHLIKKERIKQNLGVCWRCKTPIEILVKKQWFVAVKELIDDVREAAEEMRWIPEHMKMRLLNWTGSMDWDWCISRQRVFATPIPVWYCKDCGRTHLATEDMLPVDPTQTSPDFECECGGREFIGEKDVLDTWMDSSISPLALAGWPNPEYKRLFPATLRPQGHDIIRTWAFYTILRCKALTGEKPFDEIIINGMVFGEDGHKMSKSRGNVITPEEVLEDYGADALRLWASNSVPGSDVPFAWKDVKYAYKFLRKFWNAFRFISFHLEDVEKEKLMPLDNWILSKLNRLILEVTSALEDYNFAKAINSMQMFIWHQFCDEYIEAVKYRLYSDDDLKSKRAAQWTLGKVLETSLKLLAPMAPHFTEEVYQHIAEGSIHTTRWPSVEEDYISEEVEAKGDLVIEVIGALRRFKSSNRIPLNAPIEKVNIYTTEDKIYNIIKDCLEDIKGTIKIQELELIMGKPEISERIIEVKPLMEKIGPKFRGEAPTILSFIKSKDPEEIYKKLEKDEMIEIKGHKITREYLKIKKEAVGSTGEKVEVIHLDDIILEIVP